MFLVSFLPFSLVKEGRSKILTMILTNTLPNYVTGKLKEKNVLFSLFHGRYTELHRRHDHLRRLFSTVYCLCVAWFHAFERKRENDILHRGVLYFPSSFTSLHFTSLYCSKSERQKNATKKWKKWVCCEGMLCNCHFVFLKKIVVLFWTLLLLRTTGEEHKGSLMPLLLYFYMDECNVKLAIIHSPRTRKHTHGKSWANTEHKGSASMLEMKEKHFSLLFSLLFFICHDDCFSVLSGNTSHLKQYFILLLLRNPSKKYISSKYSWFHWISKQYCNSSSTKLRICNAAFVNSRAYF